MSSLHALHGVDSPIYGNNADGFMLRSSVHDAGSSWRLEAVTCSAEDAVPAWYEATWTAQQVEKRFRPIDRPADCDTYIHALLRHIQLGHVCIDFADDGPQAVTVSIGSSKPIEVLLEKVSDSATFGFRLFTWLKESSQARLTTASQAAALARNADPARVAELESQLKSKERQSEQLRAKLTTAEALSSSQSVAGSSRARGPPPAKRPKGEVNLLAAGRKGKRKSTSGFATDSDDNDDPDKTDED